MRRVLAAVLPLVLAGGVAAAVLSGGDPPTPAAAAPARHDRPAVATNATAARTLYPLPAAPVAPKGCPPPPFHGGPGRPLGKPAVAENRVPGPVRVPARHVDLAPVEGTGEWVTVFAGGRIDSGAIVKQAVAAHLTSIWIRTGSTKEGFYGAAFLPDLLARAHAAGIRVLGWDFAYLSNPVADAHRADVTMNYRTPAGDQLDGFGADIETSGEGTFLTAKRVVAYLSRVEARAGSHPVVGIVLRATDYWWNGPYPYHPMARYVDAFAPMIYWSCTEPGAATQPSVDRLRSLGKPVHVIGQGYDMGGEGGRVGLPSGQETWRFLDVANRRGAVGASLYLYGQATRAQWTAVADYPWKVKPAALSRG